MRNLTWKEQRELREYEQDQRFQQMLAIASILFGLVILPILIGG